MTDHHLPIPVSAERIAEYCRRWGIIEFALFGSVLRDDFGPESDIDVLVTLAPETRLGLLSFARMQRELTAMFGRPVDVALKRALLRRPDYPSHRDILASARVLYAA